MLDARYVSEHLDEVRAALGRRSAEAAKGLEGLTELAARRRAVIVQVGAKQAQRNAANQDMARLAKTDRPAFDARREDLKTISTEISTLESELGAIEGEMEE